MTSDSGSSDAAKMASVLRPLPNLEGFSSKCALDLIAAENLARFSTADLATHSVRQNLAPHHPVKSGKFYIRTDESERFYFKVEDHVVSRKPGLYGVGEYRVGKTTAIEQAIQQLAREYPWLATRYFTADRNPHTEKLGFCRGILKQFGYPVRPRDDAPEILVRLAMADAAQCGSATWLLFIDEAQMLTTKQLGYLLEIWNRLQSHGFTFMTVLVGQDGPSGLESVRALNDSEDAGAVVARFFVMPYYIGGLHNEDELRKYLSAFDTDLAFPPESEWVYSRYFATAAFEAGWRLSAEAERLWKALLELSGADSRHLEQCGFRVAYVNEAIKDFLDSAITQNRSRFSGTDKLWRDAVLRSAQSDLFIAKQVVA
jgi:hypothetical protein